MGAITVGMSKDTLATIMTVEALESIQQAILQDWQKAKPDSVEAKAYASSYGLTMIRRKELVGCAPKQENWKDDKISAAAIAETMKEHQLTINVKQIAPLVKLGICSSLHHLLSVSCAIQRTQIEQRYQDKMTSAELKKVLDYIDGRIDEKVLWGITYEPFVTAYHEACVKYGQSLPVAVATVTVSEVSPVEEPKEPITPAVGKKVTKTPSPWVDVLHLKAKPKGALAGKDIRWVSVKISKNMDAQAKKEQAFWKKLGIEVPITVAQHNFLVDICQGEWETVDKNIVIHRNGVDYAVQGSQGTTLNLSYVNEGITAI